MWPAGNKKALTKVGFTLTTELSPLPLRHSSWTCRREILLSLSLLFFFLSLSLLFFNFKFLQKPQAINIQQRMQFWNSNCRMIHHSPANELPGVHISLSSDTDRCIRIRLHPCTQTQVHHLSTCLQTPFCWFVLFREIWQKLEKLAQ